MSNELRYTVEIKAHSVDGRSKVVCKGTMDQEGYNHFIDSAVMVLDVDEWNWMSGIARAFPYLRRSTHEDTDAVHLR